MFLLNSRKVIGIQRLLALVTIIVAFFLFPPAQPPLDLPWLENFLAFGSLVLWVVLMSMSGWQLYQDGMPSRLVSLVSFMLIVALFWQLHGRLPTAARDWLPRDASLEELSWWFALLLPNLLCLVEIVLPTPRPEVLGSHNVE